MLSSSRYRSALTPGTSSVHVTEPTSLASFTIDRSVAIRLLTVLGARPRSIRCALQVNRLTGPLNRAFRFGASSTVIRP